MTAPTVESVHEGASSDARALLDGYRLTRNSALSLIGQVAPGIAGILCIPLLVHGLGNERFGLLSLIWLGIGYFSLFDFGLGRAVTKTVAEDLGRGDTRSADQAARTALVLLGILGVIVAGVLAVLTPVAVNRLLRISIEGRPEAGRSLYLLALAVPLVVLTTGARGVLEAAQRFGIVNIVRIPTGILSYVAPVVIVARGGGLVGAVIALIALRLVGLLVYLPASLRITPHVNHGWRIERSQARRLFTFGSWIAVSNLISPLMTAADRFVIGGALSVAALTYYATPFEAVSKVLLIPGAVSMVLFPAFAAAAVGERRQLDMLYNRGFWISAHLIMPVITVIVLFAPELLSLWLGGDFASQATTVTRWLAIGILANGLAQIPYAMLQGIGRSDVTAKLHMAELVPYVLLLFGLLHYFGLTGVAIAWAARSIADALLLLYLTARLAASRPAAPDAPMIVSTACLIAGMLPLTFWMRAGLAVIAALAGAWTVVSRLKGIDVGGLLNGRVSRAQ